jgi:hypothetical protein
VNFLHMFHQWIYQLASSSPMMLNNNPLLIFYRKYSIYCIFWLNIDGYSSYVFWLFR